MLRLDVRKASTQRCNARAASRVKCRAADLAFCGRATPPERRRRSRTEESDETRADTLLVYVFTLRGTRMHGGHRRVGDGFNSERSGLGVGQTETGALGVMCDPAVCAVVRAS